MGADEGALCDGQDPGGIGLGVGLENLENGRQRQRVQQVKIQSGHILQSLIQFLMNDRRILGSDPGHQPPDRLSQLFDHSQNVILSEHRGR